MFQTNIWCYLWDVVDEGIDEVLDRLKGEAGVTGISVATSCPPVDQLRPHAGVSPRTFRSAGGVQFQPQTALYAGTRVPPVVAAWLRKGNPLAAVAEACQKRALTLRAWTTCCHSPATVQRHGTAAVKNVFGDADPAWLCPANADVREYLRAMVEDLSEHYPFDAIELDWLSFPVCDHRRADDQAGFDFGPVAEWLSRLCFCESCRQAGKRDGIDVAAAARSASLTLERCFANGKSAGSSVADFLAADPVLSEYVDWRCRQITSLVESIKRSCRSRFVVIHRTGCRLSTGLDIKSVAPHCDALLKGCPNVDDRSVESAVREAVAAAGDVSRVELGFNACSPAVSEAPALVRPVSRAASLGVRSVNIENYGLLPRSCLDWIRQASRYARRSSAESARANGQTPDPPGNAGQ